MDSCGSAKVRANLQHCSLPKKVLLSAPPPFHIAPPATDKSQLVGPAAIMPVIMEHRRKHHLICKGLAIIHAEITRCCSRRAEASSQSARIAIHQRRRLSRPALLGHDATPTLKHGDHRQRSQDAVLACLSHANQNIQVHMHKISPISRNVSPISRNGGHTHLLIAFLNVMEAIETGTCITDSTRVPVLRTL